MRKSSFLTFCFAFIPGAGEMYLGMMNKGLAIMGTFWGLICIAGFFQLSFLFFFLPVIWCYSFFDTFNIKWLSLEQRETADRVFAQRVRASLFGDGIAVQTGKMKAIIEKRHLLVGWGLVLLGIYLVLNNFFLPIFETIFEYIGIENIWILRYLTRNIPSTVVSVAVILLGVHLVRGKKKLPVEAEADFVEYKGENHE